MKRFIIKGVERSSVLDDPENFTKIVVTEGSDRMQVSDGFHTQDELYDHRIELWILACKQYKLKDDDNLTLHSPWRTKRHSDGELAFGGTWFVLGMGKEHGKQITYHLPIERWDDCDFAETLEKAPEFDGHTSADVLERLKSL